MRRFGAPTTAHRRGSGFTLVEMLVVVSLVGILAAAARPLQDLAATRSREFELRQSLRTLRTAIDAYKRCADDGRIDKSVDGSGYPPSLEVLFEGVVDAKDPAGRRIYFLRRLPRDPFAAQALAAARTWKLRSSSSPPDRPQAGDDVFDVMSTSERTALDGSRYQEW